MHAVEIVVERLTQSIHAAIISDSIFGNKRKTIYLFQKKKIILI